jgi:hypothetical protein
MAKKKNQPKEEEEQMALRDSFLELLVLRQYLRTCDQQDVEVDADLALLLANAAQEKIDYLSDKYDRQVPLSEYFTVYDLPDFIRRKGGLPTEAERIEALRAEHEGG